MTELLPDRSETEQLEELYAELDLDLADPGQTLLEIARLHSRLDDVPAAYSALRRLVACSTDFRTWVGASQLLRKLKQRGAPSALQLRVGLLGTSTLDQLAPLIQLGALVADIDVEVRLGAYGQIESEAMNPTSELLLWRPDVMVLIPDANALSLPPFSADAAQAVQSTVGRWTAVWEALRRNGVGRVLQCNYVPLLERTLGSLDAVSDGSRLSMVSAVNRGLASECGGPVSLVDVASVAAAYGLEGWHDDRYWFHAKQAVALGALPRLAREIVAVLRATSGRSRKCLITDLDGTLWGGIVGDDGVENLRLEGTSVGEAHLAVQQYLLDLKSRGVLLAVCSKNDDAIARAPFAERDDMLLCLDDFVAFVANWEPKSDNIRRIAEQLDLGLDAMVFIDDNPAERAIIRQQLPPVDVIDLPSDVSGYRRAVASYRGFESAALTTEDLQRTHTYRARAAAADLQASATSFDDYLRSLVMVAGVGPVTAATLPRVAQLIGKTNQWNLTTRRHSVETLQSFVDNADAITLTLRLSDRFADHGLVAVAIAAPVDDRLEIDTFLMSCRVIGRTVERTLVDELIAVAGSRGVGELRASYRRTEKNNVVADLYDRLGFERIEESDDEHRYRLQLGEAEPSPNPHIELRRTE